MIKTESKNVESSNWFAATEAFASFFPRYWEQTTTAPPVESAARSWMISVLIDLPKIRGDSRLPTAETATTSAMPTKTARICSIIKGIRRRRRSFFENNTITWIPTNPRQTIRSGHLRIFCDGFDRICFQQILRNLLKKKNITIIRAFAEICKKAAGPCNLFWSPSPAKDKNRKMVFVFHTTNACKTVEEGAGPLPDFGLCHFITIYS